MAHRRWGWGVITSIWRVPVWRVVGRRRRRGIARRRGRRMVEKRRSVMELRLSSVERRWSTVSTAWLSMRRFTVTGPSVTRRRPVERRVAREGDVLVNISRDPSDLLSIPKAADPVNLVDLELHPIALMDLIPRKPPFRIMMATQETFLKLFGFIGIGFDFLEGTDESHAMMGSWGKELAPENGVLADRETDAAAVLDVAKRSSNGNRKQSRATIFAAIRVIVWKTDGKTFKAVRRALLVDGRKSRDRF